MYRRGCAGARVVRCSIAPAAAMLFAAVALMALALAAPNRLDAQELFVPTVLDQFLNGLTTLSTDFTQTVTDAHGIQSERGSGSLQVQRPNKFRWDYRPQPSDESASANSGAAAAR